MTDLPNDTRLLPPPTAVRIAWALTGAFVKSPESKDIASEAKKVLDELKGRADKEQGPERDYVVGAAAVIQSTMRTLDTIYKGRELNIQENDKVRAVNLESIKQDLQFGRNAGDFFKSLPTMAITTGAGVVTLDQLVALPPWAMWLAGLMLAGVGYFANLGIIKWSSAMKQALLIKQDYERDMYYMQYLVRVRTALINLYTDIDRLHHKSFNQYYHLEPSEDAVKVVEGILKGALPTMCDRIDDHMKDGTITADLWPRCETGGKTAEVCQHRKDS